MTACDNLFVSPYIDGMTKSHREIHTIDETAERLGGTFFLCLTHSAHLSGFTFLPADGRLLFGRAEDVDVLRGAIPIAFGKIVRIFVVGIWGCLHTAPTANVSSKQMKKQGIRRIASEPHRFGASAPEEVLRETKHSLTESEKRFVQRKRLTWGANCPPTRKHFLIVRG